MVFLQQFINGLNSGSIYALIAIGYTLVYGILKLINFAHGEIMMFGAYFAFIAATTLNWPFWAVIAFSMILTAVMGVVIEFIAYRPFCAFYDLIGIIYTDDETVPCHARRFRKSECRYFNGN